MVSKGEINRAGALMRDWWSTGGDVTDEIRHAAGVVWEFRKGFQHPMTLTAVSVRGFVGREIPDDERPIVSQRLKRLPQIVHKLHRIPSMDLARMEDVGGCRAILPTQQHAYGVLSRIKQNWKGSIKRERDYVKEPKVSGYRGIHVVVEKGARRIEVQIRTVGQQNWADAVERFAGRYRLPLKDERGPDEILDWFRLAGEAIYLEESGAGVDGSFLERFNAARDRAREWTEVAR